MPPSNWYKAFFLFPLIISVELKIKLLSFKGNHFIFWGSCKILSISENHTSYKLVGNRLQQIGQMNFATYKHNFYIKRWAYVKEKAMFQHPAHHPNRRRETWVCTPKEIQNDFRPYIFQDLFDISRINISRVLRSGDLRFFPFPLSFPFSFPLSFSLAHSLAHKLYLFQLFQPITFIHSFTLLLSSLSLFRSPLSLSLSSQCTCWGLSVPVGNDVTWMGRMPKPEDPGLSSL